MMKTKYGVKSVILESDHLISKNVRLRSPNNILNDEYQEFRSIFDTIYADSMEFVGQGDAANP